MARTKNTYMGIPTYKKIDGHTYEFHSRYRTKADARREAQFLKSKMKFKTRIIPLPKSLQKGIHELEGVRYLLYVG